MPVDPVTIGAAAVIAIGVMQQLISAAKDLKGVLEEERIETLINRIHSLRKANIETVDEIQNSGGDSEAIRRAVAQSSKATDAVAKAIRALEASDVGPDLTDELDRQLSTKLNLLKHAEELTWGEEVEVEHLTLIFTDMAKAWGNLNTAADERANG